MDRESWNLLVYKVPAQPSTQRVYVWRKLKGLGALYLQQSVCLLPQRKDLQSHLEELKANIIAGSGEADLLTIWIDEPEQNAMLIERFQQQADQEYEEFLGQCRDFHSELSEERKINNLTFAELEENEAELTKLRSWLPKISDRDLFDAPKYSQATEALKACELDFQLFSQQIYQAQGIDSEPL
ncbi:ChrB domain-containing protein [Nostoc sp. 'Peltigera membranacea cyanobiont' 210A]|uniref:Chromate resistance protein ChrB n=1 Tax=Nostoc sp. 'Peltigera membranacea cyanobiont' 210A TaxID=2014529 RepID=UPI000B952928|nr:Chromate resistance protein ChrB [Nostoc sp. 'Peltigera membranacea cyanobiont' 210A]OYD92391.1 ChrB domain-containing protein [Nostoc sp. 'Peltigera membranacea cyanobiont' 210A]